MACVQGEVMLLQGIKDGGRSECVAATLENEGSGIHGCCDMTALHFRVMWGSRKSQKELSSM